MMMTTIIKGAGLAVCWPWD